MYNGKQVVSVKGYNTSKEAMASAIGSLLDNLDANDAYNVKRVNIVVARNKKYGYWEANASYHVKRFVSGTSQLHDEPADY